MANDNYRYDLEWVPGEPDSPAGRAEANRLWREHEIRAARIPMTIGKTAVVERVPDGQCAVCDGPTTQKDGRNMFMEQVCATCTENLWEGTQ